jgi:hypothetical protein
MFWCEAIVHGVRPNLLNLCNLRNLWIFHLRDLRLKLIVCQAERFQSKRIFCRQFI